jgi:hypothetical protein
VTRGVDPDRPSGALAVVAIVAVLLVVLVAAWR